jgi:hypothetical protein
MKIIIEKYVFKCHPKDTENKSSELIYEFYKVLIYVLLIK